MWTHRVLGLVIFAAPTLCGQSLAPADWDEATRTRLAKLDRTRRNDKPLATGEHGVVAGTTHATAVHAGLQALRAGGTAADAALTTAVTQVCLAMGCWVSYAGILTLVYYDAETDKVYSLNAAFNTVLEEKEPRTIPKASARPSGRTALVPGFMAGVRAVHERFGKLEFAQLFEPAIHYAEHGFRLHAMHASMIRMRKKVLARLPATKAVFTREDGEFYEQGDLFKQPLLATTLRRVAESGGAYMYEGEWARKFVAAVRAEGGKMTAKDLRDYRPLWCEPLATDYNGFRVHCHGLPANGGVHVIEALNVLDTANVRSLGRYTKSPKAFFWLTQINRLAYMSFLTPKQLKRAVPGIDLSLASRCTKKTAGALWARARGGKLAFMKSPIAAGKHSDAVVAIDRNGNVAALVHSINTAIWGETGILVDGVSIPDAAVFQQKEIERAGPGKRLPDPTEPLLVTKRGKPVLALASIGSGLHEKTIATLCNVLDYRMNVKKAIDAPAPHLSSFGADGNNVPQVTRGDFGADLLAAVAKMGLKVKQLPATNRSLLGFIVGASLDDGKRSAAAPSSFNGRALGY